MPRVMICPNEWKEILKNRRDPGQDRKDEVRNGVYFMAPDPTNLHQTTVLELAWMLNHIAPAGSHVQAGGNISDRKIDWKKNYRCPDVMVFLPGNKAVDLETHYLGGPDFLVEIVSPGDRSLKKLPFYAELGVKEVLLVDPGKSANSLNRRTGEGWVGAEIARLDDQSWLASGLLPVEFSFKSASGDKRPHVVVRHTLEGRIMSA